VFETPAGIRYLLVKTSRPAFGAHSGLLFSLYRNSVPGEKRLESEVDRPVPSSAEDKNEWSCTAVPPVRLHDVDRKNCNFLSPTCFIPSITRGSEQCDCRRHPTTCLHFVTSAGHISVSMPISASSSELVCYRWLFYM
jgi:hypothetical protein